MKFEFEDFLLVSGLFVAMLAVQEWGRRIGDRHRRLDPQYKAGHGTTEGAIFGMLGLFLAFTFSSVGERFEERRAMVAEEANAIGTAWERLDVLPPDRQPALRDLFRRYVKIRIDAHRADDDERVIDDTSAKSMVLQQEVWSGAVEAVKASRDPNAGVMLFPTLSAMFEIRTTRLEARRRHVPLAVFIVIAILTLAGSLFAGYRAAGRAIRSWFHTLGFATVLAMTLFVIIDLDYPRIGLIRIDASDRVLVELLRRME